ncbi:MAG: hypothetical protein BalsKO_00270 [Balneolaceae bacterium]
MKILAFFLLIMISSCSVFDNEQELESVEMITTADDSSFRVINRSGDPVLYLVIESNTAAVIDLAIECDDFNPNLSQKSSVKVNYTDIMGWEEGANSVWFFWTNCKGAQDSKTIEL